MSEIQRDRLRVVVLADRAEMGRAATEHVAGRFRSLLAAQPRVRAIFAAAASQVDFLTGLAAADGIDWSRVEAFHLDEYVGLPLGDERSFGRWLDDHIFSLVKPGRVELMDGGAPDPVAEAARYGALLTDGGLDLALIGIGENGHLAFNDPPADFASTAGYKLVELDLPCRQQQVREGWFPNLEAVPEQAISMTVQRILTSRVIVVTVSDERKAHAVQRALEEEVTNLCPASILQQHAACYIFLDRAAATRLSTRAADASRDPVPSQPTRTVRNAAEQESDG